MRLIKKSTSSILVIILVLCMFCSHINQTLAYNDGVYDFITRCYEIALDREPEKDGLEGWVDKLNSGETCGVSVAYG
ncbi:MAG: DUF4214 domain-containing protein, partial [Clostridia bacterium]|nr:DUF4214 domain-containing protein [Clostridia bacterium]